MKNHLEQVLAADTIQFKEEELTFMLANIGSVDPELRDGIIYSLFYRGFSEGFLTPSQIQTITKTIINENYLYRDIDQSESDGVFTRSFTALLGTLILTYDKQPPYKAYLSETDKEWLFKNSQDYLIQEHDYRGYVPIKGWAHSIAHGGDFLGSAVGHEDFPRIQVENVLKVLEIVLLTSRPTPLIDDEEQRLVPVIVRLLETDKLPVEILSIWLENLLASLPVYRGELPHFYTRLSVKFFLFHLYFKLKAKNLLTTNVASIISDYCQ